ncbi:MAG: mechanosensitive ion channel family protein [Planctomycetota bacterium]|nr:mechanosensitive ion channel family protein [Planctomycetota bacterium]
MDWKQVAADVEAWFNEAGFLQHLALAVIVYAVGMVLAAVVRGVVRRAVQRASHDQTLARFCATISFQVLRVVVLLVALASLGLDMTPLAALVGGGSVALGFAMKDTVANLAAGVLLILRRPFSEGDTVEVSVVRGVVEEISVTATLLRSSDNRSITIPNGAVFRNVITNFTGKDTRRVDIAVGIGYADDLDKARATLVDLSRSHALVLTEPAPVGVLTGLGDSSVNLSLRAWCKTADYGAVQADLTEAIKKRFDAAGISIPYPQRDVHLHTVA